jgi:hypothetical protein
MFADLKARRFKQEKGRRKRRPCVYKPVATESRRDQGASDFLELIGGGLAAALVLRDLVAHLLAFAQIAQTGALDRADMNENVRAAAIVRLDEADALLTIEPFHDASSHVISPSMSLKVGPHARGRVDRCLEEVVSGFVSKASPSRQAENR